jgi:hypothetical protein
MRNHRTPSLVSRRAAPIGSSRSYYESTMLDAILLGKTRSAVLREMFLNPDRRVSFNELVRRVKSGDGAVARELKIGSPCANPR